MNVSETRGPCQRIMTYGNFAKCRARVTSNFVHHARSCGSIVSLSFFSSTEGKLHTQLIRASIISSELSLSCSEFTSSNFTVAFFIYDRQTRPSTYRTWCMTHCLVRCLVKLRPLRELYLLKVQFTRALKRSITPTSHFRSTSYYVRSSLR